MSVTAIIALGAGAVKGYKAVKESGIFKSKKKVPVVCETSLTEMEGLAMDAYKQTGSATGPLIYKKVRQHVPIECGDRVKEAMSNVLPTFLKWREDNKKKKKKKRAAQAKAGDIARALVGPAPAKVVPEGVKPFLIPAIAVVVLIVVFILIRKKK